MSSLRSKLARLGQSGPPRLPAEPAEVTGPTPGPTADRPLAGRASGPAQRPSLDELRDRIARIVARTEPASTRPDPTSGELPFLVEHTDAGPLYVRRVRCAPAARVGRVPLVSARDADRSMLALLALDPRLAPCDPKRALYLDTETTGLSGGTGTVAFLVGVAWLDEATSSFVLEQTLLRRLGEEAPILGRLAERLADASMIVTYNGKAVDWPLIRTRFVMNRMTPPAPPPHLDLVHLARRIHRGRAGARTLVAIENDVLGRARVGDVPGGEVVACYAHYLRTGDEGSLLGVVEHNEADVLAMVALLGLYGEPVGALDGADLAGVAATLRRAGALERAEQLADEAVARGGGHAARRTRGDIAKARGDKARALLEFESLAAEVDDPVVRLELAKLYEHHAKAFERALHLSLLGTGEDGAALERRQARLRRKLQRRGP